MPRLTQIRTKDGGRAVLTVDTDGSVFRYCITEALYVSVGAPAVGCELDGESLHMIAREDEGYRAMKKALSFLSFSDKNKRTLYTKLVSLGFGKDVSRETTLECVRLGYIDEVRQLRILVTHEANSSLRGSVYIRNKLVSKGYSAADIDAVISELVESGDIDFCKNLSRLLEKKGIDDSEQRRQLMYKYGYRPYDFKED